MNLTLNSTLLLVPIEIRKDKKHYIVEDKTSGEFYEMPDICIDAINMISDGMRLADIQNVLVLKYPDEEVDLIDFAEQLMDMQLIAEIDGVRLEQIKKPVGDRLGFLWISPHIGRFFFNKTSYCVYVALFVINIILFINKPNLFPQYKDLFIFDYMALTIPALLLLTFFLVLIHELGHVLAMRAFNLSTRLEVGHRLFLIVLETDMSSVWKLPSKERNVLYLAGICFDTVILAIALITKLIVGNGSEIFLSIMSIIVLDTVIRMVYQLCVYMKTDLYYVFENASGCYNLMENAHHLISKKIPFIKSKEIDEIFTGERKTVFFYSIFYVLGVVLTVSLYFIYYIPQLLFAWKKILPGFSHGTSSNTFWDAIAFSLQIIIGIVLLLYSWRKKYVQR
jgi:putative peptide zinc metalloprotease protein